MISAERRSENITLGFRPAGKRLFRSVNREITSCRPKGAEQKMLCHRWVSSTGGGVGHIKTGLLARCFPWKNVTKKQGFQDSPIHPPPKKK